MGQWLRPSPSLVEVISLGEEEKRKEDEVEKKVEIARPNNFSAHLPISGKYEENGKIIRWLCLVERKKRTAEDVKAEGASVHYGDDAATGTRLLSLIFSSFAADARCFKNFATTLNAVDQGIMDIAIVRYCESFENDDPFVIFKPGNICRQLGKIRRGR